MLNYWFNEFICLFYLNLIDHWFNYKKVSAQAFKSHEVVKIETKHYSIKLLASQVHLKHSELSEKLIISQVNLLSILHPLLFNDFSGYIVCQLATDFIEFEKIVGAKRLWREVFIVVIELRKVLIFLTIFACLPWHLILSSPLSEFRLHGEILTFNRLNQLF